MEMLHAYRLCPSARGACNSVSAAAASQIAVAIDYLKSRAPKHIYIVVYSWGTIPAGLYAAAHPSDISSLTLFGPIVPQAGYQHDNSRVAWWSISAQERYEQLKFAEALPRGVHLLESAVDQKHLFLFGIFCWRTFDEKQENVNSTVGTKSHGSHEDPTS